MSKYVVVSLLRSGLDDKVLEYIKNLGKPNDINYTCVENKYAAELYYNHEQESQIEDLQRKIQNLENEVYKQREEHINECLMCDKFDFNSRISLLEDLLKESAEFLSDAESFRNKSMDELLILIKQIDEAFSDKVEKSE